MPSIQCITYTAQVCLCFQPWTLPTSMVNVQNVAHYTSIFHGQIPTPRLLFTVKIRPPSKKWLQLGITPHFQTHPNIICPYMSHFILIIVIIIISSSILINQISLVIFHGLNVIFQSPYIFVASISITMKSKQFSIHQK